MLSLYPVCVLGLVTLGVSIRLLFASKFLIRLVGLALLLPSFLLGFLIFREINPPALNLQNLSGTYEGLYGKFVMKPDGSCDQTMVVHGVTFRSHTIWRITKRKSIWYPKVWWMQGYRPNEKPPVTPQMGTLELQPGFNLTSVELSDNEDNDAGVRMRRVGP